MSYADVEDVKARAGRLAGAWDDTTTPGDAEIERLLRDAAATVDVALGAHGFTAPAVDAKVQAALVPVVADIALLALLVSTWPGGTGPAAVGALTDEVRNRVEGKDGKGGYLGALAAGDIGFLLYLRAQEEGDAAGAENFWSRETDYSSWLDDLQSGAILQLGSGSVVIRSPTGPTIHKDSRF